MGGKGGLILVYSSMPLPPLCAQACRVNSLLQLGRTLVAQV